MAFADWFDMGVDIGLLSVVFECVRISDAQSELETGIMSHRLLLLLFASCSLGALINPKRDSFNYNAKPQ
ncbi:hypothetical protein C451_05398 [Halococcus thailandensis JCM 13552]|uniref:Uncharacterized protein n=1 Tax=Halococcus thailandensis JCM 13552 TaxID=1227457 RepID=M0NBM2_9EURY|nr:hypothetical protein C451_05398 [Halococcus thailandensis JCM 13552]